MAHAVKSGDVNRWIREVDKITYSSKPERLRNSEASWGNEPIPPMPPPLPFEARQPRRSFDWNQPAPPQPSQQIAEAHEPERKSAPLAGLARSQSAGKVSRPTSASNFVQKLLRSRPSSAAGRM